jgi:hypothetical protein
MYAKNANFPPLIKIPKIFLLKKRQFLSHAKNVRISLLNCLNFLYSQKNNKILSIFRKTKNFFTKNQKLPKQ